MLSNAPPGQVIPTWSPPFARGPYPMEQWEAVIVEFEAPRDQIEWITPEPLKPAAHNRLLAIVVDACQVPHSLFYHEALIAQEVTYEGRSAFHIPYIWTSTDTAMLVGRELYGMPKLMCDPGRLEIMGNEVFGDLKRHGKTMLETAVVIEEEAGLADLPDLSTWVMVRHIPTPDPAWPARRQVVLAQTTGFEIIGRAWKGRGWARTGYPSTSGLHRLDMSNPVRGLYGKFKWMLGNAKILEEVEY